MIRLSLTASLLASAAAGAAAAQDPHAGHSMPAPADPHAGHAMPAAPAPVSQDPHAGHSKPAAEPKPTVPAPPTAASDPHAGHVMPTPADPHAGHGAPPAATADPHAGHAAPTAADPHAGHAMPAQAPANPHAGHVMAAPMQTGADLLVGSATPPPVITDHAADRVFGAPAMSRARNILEGEHGRARIAKVQADLVEWAPDGGGYSWEVEGWWGGDINRLVAKTEGEGQEGHGVEAAEVQLLYSRAVTRYTDVQLGLRYDLEPRSRAYAVVAADAMFPYWFEAEGSLFLSENGDLLARVEGSYDLRLTQRLILQPRAELNFAAQDVHETHTGSGLSTGELGLRLRYEVRREFAPYVGVSWERSFGRTADFARAEGEEVEDTRVVVGLRAWF